MLPRTAIRPAGVRWPCSSRPAPAHRLRRRDSAARARPGAAARHGHRRRDRARAGRRTSLGRQPRPRRLPASARHPAVLRHQAGHDRGRGLARRRTAGTRKSSRRCCRERGKLYVAQMPAESGQCICHRQPRELLRRSSPARPDLYGKVDRHHARARMAPISHRRSSCRHGGDLPQHPQLDESRLCAGGVQRRCTGR